MLALCRHKISAATKTASTAVPGVASSNAASGASAKAINAAADEMRTISATASQTAHATTPTGHAAASSRPSPVATPLPPRKRSQTGNTWPTTAPAPANSAASGPISRSMISTGSAPLPASSSSVAAARPLRPVRSTLVAPILPEPIARRSPAPASRVSSSPNGIDPSK